MSIFSRNLGYGTGSTNVPATFYQGPAVTLPPTRASITGMTDTLVDQIGRPDASSVSRYFPDAWPYRPMTFTGLEDYKGSAGVEGLLPGAASPAHTYTDWYATIATNYPYNLDYLTSRIPAVYAERNCDATFEHQANDILVRMISKVSPSQDYFATSQEALAYGNQMLELFAANLVEGAIQVDGRLCCCVVGQYSDTPQAVVKSLSAKEQAALLDARRLAYESMIHQTSGQQMNLLRSVLELKDVPQTVESVGSFLMTASAVSSILRSNPKQLVSSSAAELTLEQLAAIHLWYQFGVKPTVSDVKSFMVQIGSSPIAKLAKSDEGLLIAGQTVRSSYGIDHLVGERRIDNSLLVDEINASFTGTTITDTAPSWVNGFSNRALKYCTCKQPLPRGRDWVHKGLLFGRALKPGWEFMPDWFRDLYWDMDGFSNQILGHPTKDEIALYFNPPIKSLWNISAFSWLADWAWNASRALDRIERMSRKVYVSFEEIWAQDTWTCTPVRWSAVPVIEKPSVVADLALQPTVEVQAIWVGLGRYVYRPMLRFGRAGISSVSANVKVRGKLVYALQTPPSSRWKNVSRLRIPTPPVRLPSMFEGTLDAWRIGILCALSTQRLVGMSKALRKANWSMAKCASMWRQEKKVVNLHLLSLAVAGVLAAKEFTHE